MPDLSHSSSLLSLYSLALVTALAGGWHCVGMCASIAMLAPQKRSAFLYQTGRLASYVLLGTLAALFGHRLFLFLDRPEKWVIAGALGIIAVWILMSTWKTAWSQKFQFFLWRHRPRRWRGLDHLSLGFLNGLLPCHWLYGYLALAAGLHDPARGAVLMFCLWAGSLPWLVAVALFGQRARLLSKHAAWLPRLLYVSLGISLIAHYWRP